MHPRTPIAAAVLLATLTAGTVAQSSHLGFVPLTDLMTGSYQGAEGGLYPGGENMRPALHDKEGLAQSNRLQPLDKRGRLDPRSGKIVVLSLGMSNAMLEFQVFADQAAVDPEKNPRVQVVNGAQGGQSADVINDPGAPYWARLQQILTASGVSPLQVQVLWIKEAHKGPTGGFVPAAKALQADLVKILHIAQQQFPNARLAYFSSRIFAGHAVGGLNPEPYAYESGFAVKWLIEQQLQGDPALNFDAARGPVVAPWLSWGPYNWADGDLPRSDGLTWIRSDFAADGTHPSAAGQSKVARALEDFFKTDATTRSWYLASPVPIPVPQAAVRSFGSSPSGPLPASLLASELPLIPGRRPLILSAQGAAPGSVGFLLQGKTPLSGQQFLGEPLLLLPRQVFLVAAGADGTLRFDFGILPADSSLAGQAALFQLVRSDAASPSGFRLSQGLELTVGH